MFKVGDKVQRHKKHKSHWWNYEVCSLRGFKPNRVFVVSECLPSKFIKLENCEGQFFAPERFILAKPLNVDDISLENYM